MDTETVTVLIPAYNEASRIGPVVRDLTSQYDVLVIDDGSDDETVEIAREAGANVLENERNQGYIDTLKRGFRRADGEILVTIDADGEHDPADVARLIEPIRNDKADLVFGARETIPRPSERILNWLARLGVNVSDTGTGFRAIRSELAQQLELDTACTCGTVALEAAATGARLTEVRVHTREIAKPRSIAWEHGRQFGHVVRYLVRSWKTR